MNDYSLNAFHLVWRLFRRSMLERNEATAGKPTSEAAGFAVLWRGPSRIPGSQIVTLFPSRTKRFWEFVWAKTDLPAVRICDLHHTFPSLLDSDGMTLPMICMLLGARRANPQAMPACSLIRCAELEQT